MKKENMNNKGFSLVELIIVIAIMAILIVVLAPQYLKYVERSRNSTDMQNVTTLKNAIETYAADPQATPAFVGGDKFKISVTSTNIDITGTAAAKAKQAVEDAALVSGTWPSTDIKCSSRTRWANYDVEGEVLGNGSIDWTYSPAALDSAMKGNS